MTGKEKASFIAKIIREERARIAPFICPLCKHIGLPDGKVHAIVIEPLSTTGTWVQCLAAEVFDQVDNTNAAPEDGSQVRLAAVPPPPDAATTPESK